MNKSKENIHYSKEDICVISQPTFLPWLGWFDLVDQAKKMVLLDDVIFTKRSWQQRNTIRTLAGLEYLTIPVKKSGRYYQKINECEIVDKEFAKKIFRKIRINYQKAKYYDLVDPIEKVFFENLNTNKLLSINFGLIKWICKFLKIKTEFILSSDIPVNGERGEYLALICDELGFRNYLSTPGSEQYLKEDLSHFKGKKINVYMHEYEHPLYKQIFNPFIPFASILDLILNEGTNSLAIIRSGRRSSRLIDQKHLN